MKFNKKILLSVGICLILIFNSAKVFAMVPAYSYNTVNVIISYSMKAASIIISLAYIIFSIVYLKKSNEEKSKKNKKIIVWLIVTIIAAIGLWFGSNLVYEAGKTINRAPDIEDMIKGY